MTVSLRVAGAAMLAAAASAGTPAVFKRVHFDAAATAAGAVCLDGSPYGVYFAPGVGNGTNNWVIYFEGGGWCYNQDDCYGRSSGNLGSSVNWPAEKSAGGVMSMDNSVNPATANWNHLYLAYCDGNSFAGNRDEPLVVNGKPLYMAGHKIVDFVLDQVLGQNLLGAPVPFSKAYDVLLTGCSAGGLATYLHADYVGSKLPAVRPPPSGSGRNGRYFVTPISGFFLDAPSMAGPHVYGTQMQVVYNMQNASGGVNAACVADKAPADQWQCNMAPYVFPYITSNIFVLNSHSDSWQSGCIMTAEPVFNLNSTANGNCSATPDWQKCAGDPNACTPAQISQGYDTFSSQFVQALNDSPTGQRAGNGYFLHSCHTHCEGQSDDSWARFQVGGVSMADAFAAWIASDNAPAAANSHFDCVYSPATPHLCNPTC